MIIYFSSKFLWKVFKHYRNFFETLFIFLGNFFLISLNTIITLIIYFYSKFLWNIFKHYHHFDYFFSAKCKFVFKYLLHPNITVVTLIFFEILLHQPIKCIFVWKSVLFTYISELIKKKHFKSKIYLKEAKKTNLYFVIHFYRTWKISFKHKLEWKKWIFNILLIICVFTNPLNSHTINFSLR